MCRKENGKKLKKLNHNKIKYAASHLKYEKSQVRNRKKIKQKNIYLFVFVMVSEAVKAMIWYSY